MESIMQSLDAMRDALATAAVAEEAGSRLAQVRYLRFLMRRFEKRATDGELQDSMLAVRYFLSEDAVLLPDDRADADLIGAALSGAGLSRSAGTIHA